MTVLTTFTTATSAADALDTFNNVLARLAVVEGGLKSPSQFSMTQLTAANQVYQRDTLTGGKNGAGVGVVPVSLNITTEGPIYARCRAVTDNSVVQPAYVALVNAAVQNGLVMIPNVSARLGQFYLDLSGDGVTWQNGTTPISMGDLIAAAGQSLAAEFWGDPGVGGSNASLGVTSANVYGFATYDNNAGTPTWARFTQTPDAYSSAFGGELGTLLSVDRGCDIGIIGSAVSGSLLSTWISGQANGNKLLSNLAAAGGKWRETVWYQGHSEAKGLMPRHAYRAGLDKIFAQFDAANSYGGVKRKYVGGIPTATSSAWGAARNLNNIRRAQMEWATANGATYIPGADVATHDGIHESNLGNRTLARHFYRAMKNSDVGPRLVSATRSGVTITATLANAGTALVGSGAWSGIFKVFNTGSVRSIWPVASAAIVNATTVTITLANDPGVGNVVDLWMGFPFDPQNDMTNIALRDNVVDGDALTEGRASINSVTPIVIAAPTPGGAVNTPPGGVLPGLSNYNANASSATYGAEVLAGFGTVMTGGYARSSNFPNNFANTIEAYFVCPTPVPTSDAAIFDLYPYLTYINSAGKIVVVTDGANLVGGTTLVAGNLYHIAVTRGAAGTACYLKNITAGTAATLEVTSSTAYPSGVASQATFGLRVYNINSRVMAGGALFHVAMWEGVKYANLAAYSPPATPYVGDETNLFALWRLNGDANDSRLDRPT